MEINLLKNPVQDWSNITRPATNETNIVHNISFEESFVMIQLFDFTMQSDNVQSSKEFRESPINNNYFNLYKENRYQRDVEPYFGNDFYLTTGNASEHNYQGVNQYTSVKYPLYKDMRSLYMNLPDAQRSKQFWTIHLPFISSCDDFGAFLPLEVLIKKNFGEKQCALGVKK